MTHSKRLKVILPLGILAVGAGLTFVMIALRPEAQEAPMQVPKPLVRAEAIAPVDYRFMVETQGTVSPHAEIDLATEVSGKVQAVSSSFVNGGFFEVDEVLVTIDTRDYAVAMAQAEARLAEASVRLQREKAEAEVALREWKNLGKGKEPSDLLLRKPQLAEAEAGVASAKANVEKAQLDLDRCQIRAPFAGRVRDKQVDLGQYLNRGQAVARIYTVDFVEVLLPLPLDQVGYVDLPVDFRDAPDAGGRPKVYLEAVVGREKQQWEGRIVRTHGEIDPRTRMVTAVARVDDPYKRSRHWRQPPLAVGLFVHARIEGRAAGEVTIAPRGALRGVDQIMVVDQESRLRFRDVIVLQLLEEEVVFKGGLAAGDRVCLSPLEVAVDGMEVRLLETREPRDLGAAALSVGGAQ